MHVDSHEDGTLKNATEYEVRITGEEASMEGFL